MKNITLLIAIILSGSLTFSQSLDGVYKNGEDSISFRGDQATFYVSGFGGLFTSQAGAGNYEQVDEYVLIHTGEYPGNKSSFQALDSSRQDTCIVKVVTLNNQPIQGILVETDNSSSKTLGGVVTRVDGRINLNNMEKTKVITVSGMGYNTITINYELGKDYLVRLTNNEIIEDKTVVLSLKEIDDETISILLLSDNFSPKKKRDKELKKIEKRAAKNNLIYKRFKKVYEPHIRKTN